ncbi:MAG: antitoxin family protein [Pseudomonadota bacterium]
MLNTVRAVVRDGRIELLEPVDLPEGSSVLVTLLVDEDTLFWSRVAHHSLNAVWDNAEDDVYAQLLQE